MGKEELSGAVTGVGGTEIDAGPVGGEPPGADAAGPLEAAGAVETAASSEEDALLERLRKVRVALTDVQRATVKGLLSSIEAVACAPLGAISGQQILEGLGLGLEAAMGASHAAPLLKDVQSVAELAQRVRLLVGNADSNEEGDV